MHNLENNHQAKKSFGQNFLQDRNVIDKIIKYSPVSKNYQTVEIGPGLGALTTGLLRKSFDLKVIEKDRDVLDTLFEKTKNIGSLEIFNTDALRFDFAKLLSEEKSKLNIIGNLPYNISTPLIFHLLTYRKNINQMFFMLQKEVVERISASPSSSSYGRLSVMVQSLCQVTAEFIVPPTAFSPQPKVYSQMIILNPYENNKYQINDYDCFEFIVKTAFSMKRKTLHNNLKKIINIDAFKKSNIDSKRRAETLSVQEFVDLSNCCVLSIKKGTVKLTEMK